MTGPATQITAAPNGPTNATSATFGLSTEAGARLVCRIDGGAWETCSGTYERYNLPHGRHVFEAYAVDTLDNPGPVVSHRVGDRHDGPGDDARPGRRPRRGIGHRRS